MGYEHDRIKSNAKRFYELNRGNAILVVLINIGISLVTNAVSTIIPGLGNLAAVFFITYPMTLCMFSWYQRAIHYDNYSLDMVFEPLKVNYLSIVGTLALKYLYIFLWSMLFIIPGVIKYYSYSMTEYIKAENPNLPSSRAIELSMIMTDGYKGKLFYLDLSFIGWFLLSSFTLHILAIVFVFPYQNAAKAFAYEELKAIAINSGRISAEELNPAINNNIQYQ